MSMLLITITSYLRVCMQFLSPIYELLLFLGTKYHPHTCFLRCTAFPLKALGQ